MKMYIVTKMEMAPSIRKVLVYNSYDNAHDFVEKNQQDLAYRAKLLNLTEVDVKGEFPEGSNKIYVLRDLVDSSNHPENILPRLPGSNKIVGFFANQELAYEEQSKIPLTDGKKYSMIDELEVIDWTPALKPKRKIK